MKKAYFHVNPRLNNIPDDEPNLEELIYKYYASHFGDKTAQQFTKEYIDKLIEIIAKDKKDRS